MVSVFFCALYCNDVAWWMHYGQVGLLFFELLIPLFSFRFMPFIGHQNQPCGTMDTLIICSAMSGSR